MDVTVRPRASDRRSDEDTTRLRELSTAVYSLEETQNWPGRHIEWATSEFDVEILDEHGELVSYTGLVIRRAHHDGTPVLIGGIGGVKTHPSARGRGLAPRGIQAALDIAEEKAADFALLVCEDHLTHYYIKGGWELFGGTMLTTQRGEKVPFDFNNVMVRSLNSAAPSDGVIDLDGPPW